MYEVAVRIFLIDRIGVIPNCGVVILQLLIDVAAKGIKRTETLTGELLVLDLPDPVAQSFYTGGVLLEFDRCSSFLTVDLAETGGSAERRLGSVQILFSKL